PSRAISIARFIPANRSSSPILPPDTDLMAQLSFKWPLRQSYAPQDFIVSAANAEAARFLERWPDGQAHAALISGPEASGKTHLAMGWAERNRASIMDIKRLGSATSQELWGNATAAVLEDIPSAANETALFHLLRHAEAHGLA